jgi:hypothetical protein
LRFAATFDAMRLLESPRRRRRLTIATIAVVIAIPAIYLAAHFTTSGSPQNANGPYLSDSFYRQPKHVPFTAAKRRAVRTVLAKFIDTAVARRNVGDSWDLAGPTLRRGVTYQEWQNGQIPVVPYPAAQHGQGSWNLVNYSYRNRVGLELLLFPRSGSGYSVATAETDVVRGQDGRWRVDYWMLTKFHGPGATAAADSASAQGEGAPNVHKLPGKKNRAAAKASRRAAEARPAARRGDVARLDKTWILVPVALLSLVVLVPLGVGVGGWIRNRRAAAAYNRTR